jgi:hypothetical protein
MKVFVCVDDGMGTMFNHRRQSRDRILCADAVREVTGRLLCTPYTARLLGEYTTPTVTDSPLEDAGAEDSVFVEGEALLPYLDKIDTLVLYRWNRRYPRDLLFDLPLDQFTLTASSDMEGYSHEKITKEIYRK